MKYIVDRIENDIAVLETDNNKIININISNLPKNIHEGTILEYINNSYITNDLYEQQKRKEIEEKFKKLRSN